MNSLYPAEWKKEALAKVAANLREIAGIAARKHRIMDSTLISALKYDRTEHWTANAPLPVLKQALRSSARTFLVLVSALLVTGCGVRKESNVESDVLRERLRAVKLFDKTTDLIRAYYYDPAKADGDWQRLRERYREEIRTSEDVHLATASLIAKLGDPCSGLIHPGQIEQMWLPAVSETRPAENSPVAKFGEDTDYGNYVPFQADISTGPDGNPVVTGIWKFGTADLLDVQKGDVIIGIEDESVQNRRLAEVLELLAWRPTDAVFARHGQRRLIKLSGREVLQHVQFAQLPDGIRYLSVDDFMSLDLPGQLHSAMQQAGSEQRALLIDLRGNQGGLLRNGYQFLAEVVGPLDKFAKLKGRKQQADLSVKTLSGKRTFTGPIVILVDRDSASCTELVTAALQDKHLATIVGEQTRGIFTVKEDIPLDDVHSLRLATSKWVHDGKYNDRIHPDIEVVATPEDLARGRGHYRRYHLVFDPITDLQKDVQLKAAYGELQRQLKADTTLAVARRR
jgi:C-terminal processing protease CtpA/Prc